MHKTNVHINSCLSINEDKLNLCVSIKDVAKHVTYNCLLMGYSNIFPYYTYRFPSRRAGEGTCTSEN